MGSDRDRHRTEGICATDVVIGGYRTPGEDAFAPDSAGQTESRFSEYPLHAITGNLG